MRGEGKRVGKNWYDEERGRGGEEGGRGGEREMERDRKRNGRAEELVTKNISF